MTMHWRRIDGVNEPEHVSFGDGCRRAGNQILIAAANLIQFGLFYKLSNGRQLFVPEIIEGIPVTHFMEIEPPEQPETPPSIIDTKKYGAE